MPRSIHPCGPGCARRAWVLAPLAALAACGPAEAPVAALRAEPARDVWRISPHDGMAPLTSASPGGAPTVAPAPRRPRGAPVDPDDLPGPTGSPDGGARPPRGDELTDLGPVRVAIRRCFETALQRDPATQGPGSVRVRLRPDGSLDRVLVDGRAPRTELERCLARAFEGVRGPEGGDFAIPLHVDIQ